MWTTITKMKNMVNHGELRRPHWKTMWTAITKLKDYVNHENHTKEPCEPQEPHKEPGELQEPR